jgi:hypothetical protein
VNCTHLRNAHSNRMPESTCSISRKQIKACHSTKHYFKILSLSSQKTHSFSITNINLLLLSFFGDNSEISSETHMKHTDSLIGQWAEFLMLKQLVCIATTVLQRVKRTRTWRTRERKNNLLRGNPVRCTLQAEVRRATRNVHKQAVSGHSAR